MLQETSPNILIVDSNKSFLHTLVKNFREEGFQVFSSSDEISAQVIADEHRLDAALINTSLKNPQDSYDFTGIDLAHRLRPDCPVVLFAENPSHEMMRAAFVTRSNNLAPACDIIYKHEGVAVMMQAIERIIKIAQSHQPVKTTGRNYHPRSTESFALNNANRAAEVLGKSIGLNEREYNIISYMMDNAETLVSRKDIVVDVFAEHYDVVADGNRVNNIISRLRKHIEPDPNEPQFLITRWGSGWMFFPDGNAPELA